MEGKYAVKLSITKHREISRKWRKRYNGRLLKMQMWSESTMQYIRPHLDKATQIMEQFSNIQALYKFYNDNCNAKWLRGRTSNSWLREPGFESCAAVLKTWASFFILHCSSSLSCINEYLTIDSDGYVYEQPSRINCSIWVDASQRSRDGIWVNRSVRKVKCKAL